MASTMYSMSPVGAVASEMELPTCMYRLPQLQGDGLESSSQGATSAALSSTESFASLEQRQLATIADLKDLQRQVRSLATRLNVAVPPLPGSTSDQQIVVHASPNQPPTAVVVLFRLLAQQLPVRTAVYVHSSLKSLPGSLCHALKDVPNCADSQASQAIRLVLVWREVPDDEPYMVTQSYGAGASQCCVRGQQNIGRYLSRAYLPSLYEGQDPMAIVEIDRILSGVYLKLQPGSQAASKEQAAALKDANVLLGRNAYLAGEHISLADVLLFSLLVKSSHAVGNNVKAWLKRLSALPVMSCAI